MNVRHYLKCDVCGSIILTRTQLGWFDSHPIRFDCGKCGILISGTVFMNQENGTFRFEFNNAKNIDETKPDYYIEASGELLTEKLQVADFDNEYYYTTPPFFNTKWAMGDKNFEKYKKHTIRFLQLLKTDWPKLRRINELWLNGNTDYLKKEVKELLPEKQFPMKNNLEYLRGVHQLNLIFFSDIIQTNFFKSITHLIWEELDSLGKNTPKGLFDLVTDFKELLGR